MRRFFNRQEKQALWLAANGRCEACGTLLLPGWHADHERSWAAGGLTDVLNGQALCAACNLKKGRGRVAATQEWPAAIRLRDWQQEAYDRWIERRESFRDFFLVACPGAGKTTALLRMAWQGLAEGEAERLVVVCPTRHLCTQWAKKAAEAGLSLNPDWTNSDEVESDSFHGLAVTYQQVAANPNLHRRLCRRRTIGIFDEIHHAGDPLSWAAGLREAFETCRFRLSASGTLFRGDNHSIAWLRYDEGLSDPDYSYSYGRALQDNVCRPVFFPKYEGQLEWWSGKQAYRHSFGDELEDEQVSERLRTALSTRGDWLPAVLSDANEQVKLLRSEGHGDAAGLVIAMDQEHARAVAERLKAITGRAPTLAISDEANSSDAIERFRKGTDPWIVAVKMISEGVDLPRTRVLVYATQVVSRLFFRQVLGRVTRVTPLPEEQCAYFYIPRDERLVALAAEIMSERDHQLAEEVQRSRERGADREEGPSLRVFAPISSEAFRDGGIMGRETISQSELVYAEEVRVRAGVRSSVGDTALILRAAGLAAPSPAEPVAPLTEAEPLFLQMKKLRGLNNRLANKVAMRVDLQAQDVHTLWLKAGGMSANAATLEDLEKKRDWLLSKLEEDA